MNRLKFLVALTVFILSQTALAKKVVRLSEDEAPTNFDPLEGATTYSNTIITAIYDTLYEYKYLKEPYELKPNLADGFPETSKDGLTFTIKIKKGVMFADDACFPGGKGREVVADDFIYSIKRHFHKTARSQGAWLWQGRIAGLDDWAKSSDYSKPVEGLKALDKHTIQIKLVKPFPQMLYTLAMGFSGVVPREAVEKYGREFAIKPVGSGPWMLKSHHATKTVLVRNSNYRKEVFDVKEHGYDEKTWGFTGIGTLDGKTLPIVDEIEMNWMSSQTARWNSFTKGNEVVNTVLQPEQVTEVLESKNPIKLKKAYADKYHYIAKPEVAFVFHWFNMDSEEFGYSKDPVKNAKNKALRCALTKGYNWQEQIDKFYLGIGQAFPGSIPPGIDGFDENLSKDSITYDVEGAKKLLKDAGWTPETLPEITYGQPSSVKSKQMYEFVRGNWAKIGYPPNKIKYKPYANFGDFNKAVKLSQLPILAFAWGLDYPDAENTLALYYGPNRTPGANSSNYSNPEYDKLFEKASVMMPSPERTAIYRKLNQMVIDDCVAIAGFARMRINMWHKNVVMAPRRDILGNYFKYIDVK